MKTRKQTTLFYCLLILPLAAPLAPRVAAAEWAGITADAGGFVDTSDWLGWLYVPQQPWLYSFTLNLWIYADDPGTNASGVWAYLPLSAVPSEKGGAPTRVASFGPNGTHWPQVLETPFMYDPEVPHIIDVDCSWAAIRSAIQAVTEAEANAGVLIRVAPGALIGNGSGSTSKTVLEQLGSASWNKRITVAARDGFGSVTVTGGARIFKVQGVCFAGFDFDGLAFHANHRSALAWSRVGSFMSAHGTTGATVQDVEFVEVVTSESAVTGGDSWDCFSAGAIEMSGYTFVGCYVAPRYRPAGSSSHTDTVQFEPTSGGSDYTDVTMLDCAFFASSNCAIQVNAIDGLTVEHTYIAGGATAKTRYPFTGDADTGGANNCFNGGGINMKAIDSCFIGGISGTPGSWISAENTRTTYTGTNIPTTGSWIVDSSLSESNPEMPPYPSSTYLGSIWGNPLLAK